MQPGGIAFGTPVKALLLAALMTMALVVSTTPAFAQGVVPPEPDFETVKNHAVGTNPSGVATGDLNNDGKLDVVTSNQLNSVPVSVALGNGEGGFGTSTIYPTNGDTAMSVALADFNNNGSLDIVVASHGSNNVSVLFNNGQGVFSAPTTFPVGQTPFGVTTGDFNNDGNADIATANLFGGASVRLGNGQGGFPTLNNFSAGAAPFGITAANLDNDADTDLVVSNIDSNNNISVLLNNGQGSFSTTNIASGGNHPRATTVGNFNGDAFPDIVAANANSDNVSLFSGNGQGGFSLTSSHSVGDLPSGVTKGDFNNDGILDVAASNGGTSDNVSVLSGNGQGGFSAADNFAVANDPSGIRTGDFNNDARPDLVTSNYTSNNVSVLLNDFVAQAPPVAVNDAYDANEDTTLTVNAANGVLANDTDVNENDTLTASIRTNASNGSVTLESDGSFAYTPDKDFFGVDSFTYVANDGTAESEPATVTITVANVNNDAPVAMDDFEEVEEDTPEDIQVVANDTDPDEFNDLDPTSVTIKTEPAKGTAVANDDGTVTYTPNENATGADSFTYEVCDKGVPVKCDEATVDVQITPVSDDTIAREDSYDVNEDGVLNVAAPGVLENDEDPDGPLTAVVTSEPNNGTLVLNPDGSFTYTPNADFSGSDVFFYRASDTSPGGGSDETAVNINVLPVEDPPPPAEPAACNDGHDNDGDRKSVV